MSIPNVEKFHVNMTTCNPKSPRNIEISNKARGWKFGVLDTYKESRSGCTSEETWLSKEKKDSSECLVKK